MSHDEVRRGTLIINSPDTVRRWAAEKLPASEKCIVVTLDPLIAGRFAVMLPASQSPRNNDLRLLSITSVRCIQASGSLAGGERWRLRDDVGGGPRR